MATKNYTVMKRRKREGKTNYKKRIKLVSSRKPRLAVRRYSNKILVQIIEFSPKGDKVTFSFDSRKLKKLGWTGHTGNIPAAYLTGLYVGKKSGVSEAVVDFGVQHSVVGSSLYAAIKGAIDGGIKLSCDEKMFPKEDRLFGKHNKTEEIVKKIKLELTKNGKG